jgi:hypothetical protein
MTRRDRRPIGTDELYAPLEDRLRSMRSRVEQGSLRALDYVDDFDDEDGLDNIVAIMSGAARKGQWEPAGKIRVLAVMGGVELDFREADLLEGTTEISILAIMGGCQIVMPSDVGVEVNGSGFMGGFTHLQHRPPDEDAPLIRIKGLAVMGGVEVKIKKS